MPMPKGLDFKLASTVTLAELRCTGLDELDLNLGEICVVQGSWDTWVNCPANVTSLWCRTIVIDLDEHRLEIAKSLGAEADTKS